MIAALGCRPRRRLMPFLALGLAARAFAHHRGRGGPFGGGGPWAFGPFGPAHRGKRRFDRGDLKFVILDLLSEGPRHGYDIIRALEERFHGLYSPSPGSVYPTLQLLEDQEYVTSDQQEGKRVYTITDAGRAFLKERASTMDDIRARMAERWGPGSGPELRDLMDEVRQVGQTLFAQAGSGALRDPSTIRRLREVVARARTEIEAIFRGDGNTPGEML